MSGAGRFLTAFLTVLIGAAGLGLWLLLLTQAPAVIRDAGHYNLGWIVMFLIWGVPFAIGAGIYWCRKS